MLVIKKKTIQKIVKFRVRLGQVRLVHLIIGQVYYVIIYITKYNMFDNNMK